MPSHLWVMGKLMSCHSEKVWELFTACGGNADYHRTLYWNPALRLDSKGEVVIEHDCEPSVGIGNSGSGACGRIGR